MHGANIPPNFLFYMAVAIVIGPGLWMLLLMWAFGDAHRIPWKRLGQAALVCIALAGLSQAQAPALAQQDSTTRRVERLEDQATGFTANDADLKAIVAQQKDMLTQLIAANAKQDERITANNDALQKIATAAETIKETQDDFANRVTWVGSILVAVVIVAGFVLDRIREKRMGNGHGPFAGIKDQIQRQQETIDTILRTMPQSRRRT